MTVSSVRRVRPSDLTASLWPIHPSPTPPHAGIFISTVSAVASVSTVTKVSMEATLSIICTVSRLYLQHLHYLQLYVSISFCHAESTSCASSPRPPRSWAALTASCSITSTTSASTPRMGPRTGKYLHYLYIWSWNYSHCTLINLCYFQPVLVLLP